MTETARSADGTSIAFERVGSGPAVVCVDAAGAYRDHGPMRPIAAALADSFTVFTYDRRGRGQSGDTLPYAVEREIDDLAAVIAAAGGRAHVYAFSSGGLIALHAAAAGVPIDRMALLEPPLGEPGGSPLTGEMRALVGAGKHSEAAAHFLAAIGVPEEYATPEPGLVAVAPTLVYDCVLGDQTSLELIGRVNTKTLVIDSEGTTGPLPGWAVAIVGALPDGRHLSLPGSWHGVDDADLTGALRAFYAQS
ncbi:Lysophospholipase, alpha-beta hydrolase superfamily [Asanoa hainanensis]|uniref:Lysophospholipase, alpha-beta hydrolase superfamily n=1 Tax=Asanoa hainanensis TaxID=560556 RepID=A0A239ISX6_9ACTN|nr:alpha/beta hydrolase [Asanoa hainanensis]SNS96691.1 Lysophospholipase, alpha-beta hydrolase superfamily [Asanoa hainanensis]